MKERATRGALPTPVGNWANYRVDEDGRRLDYRIDRSPGNRTHFQTSLQNP